MARYPAELKTCQMVIRQNLAKTDWSLLSKIGADSDRLNNDPKRYKKMVNVTLCLNSSIRDHNIPETQAI